jgi:hypothetical protein
MAKLSLTALLLMAGSIGSAQQVLILTSGVQIQGKYAGGDANTVDFLDQHGDRHSYPTYDIKDLVFNLPAAPPDAKDYPDKDVEPAVGWVRYKMLPAGTEIAVETAQALDTRDTGKDQPYLGSINEDVRDSTGNVVIPKGSAAHLVFPHGDDQGKIILRSVSLNGQRYLLGAVASEGNPPGTQLITRRNEPKVAPATVLRFRLDQPVYLYQ